MSGFDSNIPKTVLISLFDGVTQLQRHMNQNPTIWKHIEVSGVGTYLGFKLGPERNETVWDAPLHKFGKRIEQWRGIHTGTYLATLAYNTSIASTLFFIAQLNVPPEHALNKDMHGIKAFFGGSGGYDAFSPAGAFPFKEQLGQHMSYKSLDCRQSFKAPSMLCIT